MRVLWWILFFLIFHTILPLCDKAKSNFGINYIGNVFNNIYFRLSNISINKFNIILFSLVS